ncbi:uncharacterized protein LOC129573419 [Sitodiplosis mosellana]|uniref:uncharacterized protein LOC129573419 n=1 Tax=Sitodiplosis mosellana TaxID=263140 RepID=UPI0024444C2D|nr:uncharacterized protein LOC129573419 [Sitodiplosis mosellana]
MYIGGAAVARGYLNHPKLTAERFLLDPFSDNPQARMFRTGDRARYLPDGNLVYLGRIDQQVKVRGFRIEPGEIEAHLVEHPQVREAVVKSYGNGTDAHLVAYVVADANTSLAKDLRTYLSTLLPEHMVPVAYVCLPSLPLTPNGKLDRRALPAPDDEAFSRQQYEAPQGEMEETLAKIWCRIFGIEQVSRYDNFFALGGHSLLVVQLLGHLRQNGLDTSVREVFDAPNLAVLAATLIRYQAATIPLNIITTDSTEITPEMLPLITLFQADIDTIVTQVPGGVTNIQDIYGLVPLQQGMLFHHLRSVEGDPYLIAMRMIFNDRTALERYANALQKTIERHDILRTIFIWEGLREPAQIVLRKVPSLLTEVTLDDTSEPILEHLSRRFDPRYYRFELTQAPLLRLLATPTSEGSWVAIQLMHHLIIDHSTLERLQVEVHAIIDGKIEQLTTPTSFRNVVAHAQLGVKPAEHTRFFSEMLGDINEPTFPFGLREFDLDETEINEAYLKMSQVLNDQLRAHARKLQVSLASICHLAWAQVISRVSGRQAVVFGTVLLGRLQGKGNDNVMGPMINTLPLRLDLDGRCVETAVRDSHAQLSALLRHEYAPLVLAQRCSGVPADMPLFNTLLNYRHSQQTEQVNETIRGITLFDGNGRTNYPLTISLDDNDDALCLTVQVVTPMSAVRIGAYMQQVMESMVDALSQTPQQMIRTLTIIPPDERTLLLHTWNQTMVIYSPVCCLHHIFEAQVERDGQTIAVEYKGKTLSYAELNAESNRLAHYLIERGVKSDDRIALCVERSATMIIAMLGILKAGAAYVPLDPAYPSQRLTNTLHDADPIFLLTDATGRKVLGDHKVPVIDLDEPLPDDLSIDNPDVTSLGLTPNHLAYVIYTSGSTGTPKGVMVEHQQVVQLFAATSEKFDFNKQDKWCLFHSYSFDVSVWEIWGAFSNGSQLSIVPYEINRSTDEFHDWICGSGVTVLNQTPSAFKMLMRAMNMSLRTNRLRYIIFAGEELDPMIVKEWYEKYAENQTVLVNMYGTTETTVHATYQRLETEENVHTVGRPLSDLCVYLLDSYGEPVPLGAVGELYIGGAGVARGYLNQPELTAERFLPNPFSDNPQARMYRTGDRARYLPDSNLVYLGRIDQQVKVRGFRIEPGEIEAHLIENPQVDEAVVHMYGNGPDARLVAYVVADAGSSLAQDLRTYLSTLLPEYMVPVAYVCLQSLPLTPNGKLDRRALPPPDDEAFARRQYEAPQGEMEEKLADIWCYLLGVERISRHDNFFALGGHSLLVVRLLSQLRQTGQDTTVREVYNSPTLAILATKLACYEAVTIPPNLITSDCTSITPEMLPLITLSQAEIDVIIAQVPGGVANTQDIYGLAPLQYGMLFHHLRCEEGDPYLITMRMQFIDRTALERYADALEQVIKRHDILRTIFIWEDLGEPAQIVLRKVPSLLTEVTLDDTSEPVLEHLSRRFDPRYYRFELTQAPLLRLLAAPTSEGSWVAIQLMHHLIIDHSTLERLQVEIHAIIDGKIEQLTTPTSFRNVVAHAQLGVIPAEHTRFFSEMLGDIDEPTLPFGLSDVRLDGNHINESYLPMSQTLNDQLRSLALKLEVSLASICHLAWAQVLARASGCEAVVFGTVLFGRSQGGEVNNVTMGPMINTLPLRLDINETDVETAVRHTHARLSALLTHEHALLVLAQRCSRVPADTPLFSALLNYRHNQQSTQVNAALPGVSFLGGEERTNYPLILSVEDNGDSICLTAQIVSTMSAARICTYMQRSVISLADALIHTPQKPVRTLTVIPADERTLLLHTWNQITATYPVKLCLHQLFEERVKCDGRAIAVESKGEILSYAELNTKANQLAHYLISKGIKPDDLIALCVERTTTMIIAMLGILKAGGAYVPLDPVYTSQRLINILQDVNPALLLADATGLKVLGDHQVPVIHLDNPLPDGLLIENPDAINLGVTSNHLAYCIYTSGSTGTPKGVMVEHYHAAQLLQSVHDKFSFNKEDKWCLFHSISFDFSVWEIWGALCYGSQLSIVPYDITRSTDEFYDWLCASRITVLNQTPSAFKMLMQAKNINSRSHQLRYVLFGGEALNSLIVSDWFENYAKGKTVLANMYGPTETVIFASIWICNDGISENSLIPIGRPLSNKRIYLLDSYGEPVPLGAEGELYIGGAGVARGYLNRPELTKERFLPDPFSENTQARMYRTGDRARYLPDSNLVYLGRTDQQVKIRGFRIEPGEIESHLVEHSQVNEAVVQSYGSGSDARLVAYVVAYANISLAQDLCTYLSNLLPEYMVPAAYVCLPSLPLTPNGKLDRRALPSPDDEAFAHQEYEAPQGEIEEKLADIWRKLLGVERIGRHDNFFALGGHSLLVVRMLAQLRQTGLDTTVREVFDAQNLACLALTLTRYEAVTIPPNLITTDSMLITPEMLPLITLSQAEIDMIIAQVPGGVSNIQDIYGLAPLQHGMLFHHLMAKQGDPYLIVSRLSFIDRNILERYADALEQVMRRHEILRTVFFCEGLNEPVQVVLRQVPSLLTKITLNGCSEPVLEQVSYFIDPRHYRLDLTQAPLLRLVASQTSEGSWVALQLMHHIIGDHSTLERLQKEIHSIFDGQSENLTAPTPFRQAVAQARLGVKPAEHTRFFSEMLGNIDEPTMPFGLSHDGWDGTDGNEAQLKLSHELFIQLGKHARNLRVSLASVCHLAWAQVLARASGREAVVFGTVLLGRLQAGEGNDSAMGPMINTLPIRIDIDDTSVKTAVRHTHTRLSALLAHEHAPLVLAQRCSGVPAGMPLFNALLNYRNSQKIDRAITSLAGVGFLGSEVRTNYPVTISLDDNNSTLSLSVQVVSLMSAVRISTYMQQALVSLVNALTHTPQKPIRSLSVMPPEEGTMLLHTWNQTMVSYSPDFCLHQLFEAQVERTEHAIAVECKGETLNYTELNIQANRLAHYLIEWGVKPDDRIAVCVQRNLALIIAMLGILKAGGAYVPLDPAYPSQRLTNILHDANPILLLTDATGQEALGYHQIPVLELHKPLPVDLPNDNPDVIKLRLTPNHLAYVIYTSGSTGKPKGVMVEHRNVTNCLHWINEAFTAEDFKHTSFSTSVNFDMSLYECFAPLSMGATLHVIPNALALSPSSNISMLSTVPSAVTIILNADSLPLSLCALHFIGEPLKANLIKRIFTHTQVTELCNLYGQTETSFFSTLHKFKRGDEVIETIGRPIANTQIYLLDSYGEPVPLGAEGEMYIGGAAVARGYLNQPELTAERFLSNPFSDDPAARMYRTGDRARYLPDGNLAYLGRTDQQVKIRGFRIEPGEIEARIVEYPQVREAIVQSYGSGTDARLVAYIVADDDTSVVQNLRSYLSTLLPDYMVPVAYVCLPSLPLTPNGKLNRRALPTPDDEAFSRQQYEDPQGEMEEKLAGIWRELLSIDLVSRHDNFFELGGHSLLVMQFVNKAKLCNIHIDARGVFSFPILKDLSQQITHRSNRLYCDDAIPVRQYGNGAPLFLLPDGWGDISYAFELSHDIDKNIPVYVLPWPSPEDKQPSSIEEMAITMIRLMKKIQTNGPYAIAGYSGGGILAYEMTKQLVNGGDPVSFLGLIDTYPSSDRLTETVTFLTSLLLKFPVFKMMNDTKWWVRVSELTLDEAVEEINNMTIDLKNADIEWEALLSKQRHNYHNICALVKTGPISVRVHLFKAVDYTYSLHAGTEYLNNSYKKNMDSTKKLYNFPKLGWENYSPPIDFQVISVDGDHHSMISDPKNRFLLGQQMTKCIQSRTKTLEHTVSADDGRPTKRSKCIFI